MDIREMLRTHQPKSFAQNVIATYPTPSWWSRVGVGTAMGHHGELLQGVFHDKYGKPRRGLVTMPVVDLKTVAIFRGKAGSGPVQITVEPGSKDKARRAAELAVAYCAQRSGSPAVHGHLVNHTAVMSGLGLGASTSDVVASIRAVADWYRLSLQPAEIARLSVLAERASDSIMIEDRTVLFAQREGVVLEDFTTPLPPVIVVGCVAGPDLSIDTLTLTPAEYDPDELIRLQVMLSTLRHGIATADVTLIGAVATASARMNQRFLPKPELETLIAIGEAHAAAGVQVAHSGSVAGLIFDPERASVSDDIERCIRAMRHAGITHTEVFCSQPAKTGGRG
ncbi:hypothetical protein KBX50_03855 [Micromonospora sp. C51]|uniref:GHMP family kinase ATP-binding protein n=1 Tax=Micromonospora sp. C51 TaxID=2824879 RepID=UPI001B39CA49|nr:hypothetical protein [Micromonospora sp. C51]MBQ1047624.1 hypothetical protein [Micromonospora sp. C51]